MDPVDDTTAAEPESDSGEAVSDDESGSTPDQGESEGGAESESEGAPADEGEGEADGEPQQEASAEDQESEEYRNLVRKFEHITNPRDRNAAIGKAWWEKVRYASQIRKENEELKLRLARIDSEKPKKDEPPPPPPPELQEVMNAIEALHQRGQAIQVRHNEIIKELNETDRELAIAEDRLKDLAEDDDRRPLAQSRVRQAKMELDRARDRYQNSLDAREALDERLKTKFAEKDLIERFHRTEAQRRESEQRTNERFSQEFPAQVEGLTAAAAAHLKLTNLDERAQTSLWKHVNRALQADLRTQYAEQDMADVPVPQMVLSYVQEWAEDRDLMRRTTFAKESKEKARVATRVVSPGERKAPGATPKPAVPAASRPPVPVALLSRDTTPTMAKARRMLIQRLGGGVS